jgi:hypothetical protein
MNNTLALSPYRRIKHRVFAQQTFQRQAAGAGMRRFKKIFRCWIHVKHGPVLINHDHSGGQQIQPVERRRFHGVFLPVT